MENLALGMVETRGLLAAICAADTMTKAADVKLIKKEKAGGGIITVLIRGDVGAVQAAVEAAKTISGEILATHVIPRTSREIEEIFLGE